MRKSAFLPPSARRGRWSGRLSTPREAPFLRESTSRAGTQDPQTALMRGCWPAHTRTKSGSRTPAEPPVAVEDCCAIANSFARFRLSMGDGGHGNATAFQSIDPIRAAGNCCHLSLCAADLGLVGRANYARDQRALAKLAAVETGPARADRGGRGLCAL